MTRPFWIRASAWIYFVLLLLFLFLAGFLWKSGQMLVRSDPFGHVRWAVVLAGEGMDMARSQAALKLFNEGRFDSLILSGPRVFRTHHESEFSSEYLVSLGFPKERIFQLPHEGQATQFEAGTIIRQARLLGIDTLLVITSNFHSARAGRIFDKLANGFPGIRVFAAEDPGFNPEAWWAWRQSRVAWLLEWVKTLNTKWELWSQEPLKDVQVPIFLEPNPRGEPDVYMDAASTDTASASDESAREMNQIRE